VASLDVAAAWIRDGLCEIALAGVSESSLTSFYRSGFEQMGVLAHGSPQDVRPFDKNRSGFAMGEGAAVFVLERETSAQVRGCVPLAKLIGTALQHSAMDSIRFDSDGSAVARLLKTVLTEKSLGYINAHGTATVMNDLVESRGIKMALGHQANQIKISSTKAATGHLLGAAGALEAAFCVLALRDQRVPATLNFEQPDSEFDLDYVPNHSQSLAFDSSVSLSYGFGGQMGAVAFERVS
jgi:3-oxoacyl-[acyl-carrier-protein] synthase II